MAKRNSNLKYHAQQKTKEDVGDSGLGLQGEEDKWHGDGKANIWQTNVAEPFRDKGTQNRFWSLGLFPHQV